MRARLLVAALAATGVFASTLAPSASAQEYTSTLGGGSTYVGLAMAQWQTEATAQGIPITYQPDTNGSPGGLRAYKFRTVQFAGTEAEFSSLGEEDAVSRGYQYVPDVAGAVAIMYNVEDQAGREVDYLHLSRSTVARIFMGYITHWDDQAIQADNRGLVLPHQPIQVVYRSGDSGTTALFYDFVANTEPALFQQWAAEVGLPTRTRILMPQGPGRPFAPTTHPAAGSAEAATHVASTRWSIGYDEFAYAREFGADAAWVQNQAGEWVLPYAENISAALDGATLRPDLSQELSTVYTNPDPKAYPISAYSYVVTQCAPAADRTTCQGNYSDTGVADTMAAFLAHVACTGQIKMAELGYSPLPPHLSQEVMNSIARMYGDREPVQLTPANCDNPRFHGSLGDGSRSPADPLEDVECIGSECEGGGGAGSGARSSTGTTAAGQLTDAVGVESSSGSRDDEDQELANIRDSDPRKYDEDDVLPLGLSPVVALLILLAGPPLVAFGWGALRRRRQQVTSVSSEVSTS